MSRSMTVEQADSLVTNNDRYWWETYAKTLVYFTPGRGATLWAVNGYFNRAWKGRNKWGTIRRTEVSDDGLFRL